MLFNNLQLVVLEEFLGDYIGSFTGSYIARKKSLNQKSVANTLNKLENEGFLKSTTVGRNKQFFLNLDNIEAVKNLIVAAEHLHTVNFLKKYPMIKEIVLKTKQSFDGIVIIFGSYAKGTQKKDSDLDIFVAGTYNKNEVSGISELYNLQINVKNYPESTFKRAVKNKDILLNEIIKNHIMISGVEKFVNVIMRDYYGKD
ncbi:MAG: nucleotidyltransferase domain-containing protein [Candidatus Aenigmarchaeota archaeon]|nr:nucleotidyltransferase domain-containing protein [Candidatus Aenigmarchaeota archaeon]